MENEPIDLVSDQTDENPWGRREVWTHKGALAVGECRAFVDANPTADSDIRWAKAEALASDVAGDFFIDTLDPAYDAGLSESIWSTMTAMLFAYMNERGEHLRVRRIADQ
jgi:hypothetical protein